VIWDKSFRGTGLNGRAVFHPVAVFSSYYLRAAAAFLLLTAAGLPAHGREKDVLQYGAGLIVNVPLPEPEVAQVVEDVAQNTLIRGTKEYNKDEYVTGAVAATSTPVFPAWTEGGKVFYKVRKQALDPRNFKDSGDVGTLAVRYVVQPQGDKNTVLRIDALFVEDFRHSVHPSNGSVESSEYKDIQDRLQAVELMKKENAEAEQAKQERLAKKNFGLSATDDTAVLSTPPSTAPPPPASPSSATPQPSAAYEQQPDESLEQHVTELRRQVERLVKKPGAPLKSAPFHTASTMKSLEPGVEVLILISTPYWYGVETHDGQHGWIRRDQLEQLP
jgi:polyhydroxyalkanoate synthesis regulator phasin